MTKLNRKHKDRLFRLVFQKPEDLLELYNAINESDYRNPDDLIINTLDDVIYMNVKLENMHILSPEYGKRFFQA